MDTRETAQRLYDAVMETYKINNAYDTWADYRSVVSDFILEQTKDCQGGTAAILGAGCCNDIDLARLSEQFTEITLFDVDEEAMMEALHRYKNRNSSCKVSVDRTDFLGITQEVYLDFARVAIEHGLIGLDAEDALVDYMKDAYADREIWRANPESYDVVIALGLHSQLNALFPRLWMEWSQLMQLPNHHEIEKCALLENQKLIPQFDEQMLRMARRHLIVGCEKSRLEIPGGIAGAREALLDWQSRVDCGNVQQLESKNIAWKLTESKTYDMRLLSLAKI